MTGDNRTDLENFLHRIEKLSNMLASEQDNEDEQKRRSKLMGCVSRLYKNTDPEYFDSELNEIAGTLNPLKTQNKAVGFVAADEDAALIQKYILQVNRALADYQVYCVMYLFIGQY